MALTGTTVSLAPTNTTVTTFRLWGAAIKAQLAAAGLVQTADSGQVDWTTVAVPTIGAMMGYEIWRFADALQATAPVFFKLEYGAASSAAINPAIALTVGSGSNGSGTLTGVLAARTIIDCGAANATAMLCYFCGDTNRFVMALWASGSGSSSTTTLVISLERTVDAAGAVTAEGVQLIWKPGGASWKQLGWNCLTGPMTAVESSLGCLGPSVGTGASGTATSVYPIYLTKGIFLFPGFNLLGGFETNFSVGTPVTFSYYGATHTYMPIAATLVGSPIARVSSGATVLVRYD